LAHAAWHERSFAEAWYPETLWLRAQAKAGWPEVQRGRAEATRDTRIEVSVAGFFQACGSVLDNLAALAIGALGLKSDLVTASWTAVAKAAAGSGGFLQDPGAGRDLQDAALVQIQHGALADPRGWLKWTLDMRHLLVHRARRIEVRQHYRVRRNGPDLDYVLLLPRNPQLTEVEAFVLGAAPEDLVLREHAGSVMAGVLDRVNGLVELSAEALAGAWRRRREDPELVKQPAQQWSEVFPRRRDLSGFSGFRQDVPAMQGEFRVAPEMNRRFQAAKVLDDERGFWPSSLN
jgi:hypothetical protein